MNSRTDIIKILCELHVFALPLLGTRRVVRFICDELLLHRLRFTLYH
jgi:hypothetical protein